MFTNCPLVGRVNVGLTDSIPLQLPVVCLFVGIGWFRKTTDRLADDALMSTSVLCYWTFVDCLSQMISCFYSVRADVLSGWQEARVEYYQKGKKSFYSYILLSMSEYPYTVLLLIAIFGIYLPVNDGPLGSLLYIVIVSLTYHGRRKNSSEFAPHLQITSSLWSKSILDGQKPPLFE